MYPLATLYPIPTGIAVEGYSDNTTTVAAQAGNSAASFACKSGEEMRISAATWSTAAKHVDVLARTRSKCPSGSQTCNIPDLVGTFGKLPGEDAPMLQVTYSCQAPPKAIAAPLEPVAHAQDSLAVNDAHALQGSHVAVSTVVDAQPPPTAVPHVAVTDEVASASASASIQLATPNAPLLTGATDLKQPPKHEPYVDMAPYAAPRWSRYQQVQ